MSTIYLIRHGQASFGADDYDKLSALGKLQAEVLGKQLKVRAIAPSLIIAGDMRRQQQTQSHCIKQLSHMAVTPNTNTCWNEFNHQQVLSVFDNRLSKASEMMAYFARQKNPQAAFIDTFSQAIERWISGDHDHQYDESWFAFKDRVNGALEEVVSQLNEQQSAFIFTSAGTISAVVMALLAIPDNCFFKLNMNMVNCGLTTLKVTKQGVMLQTMNDYSVFDTPEHRHLVSFK